MGLNICDMVWMMHYEYVSNFAASNYAKQRSYNTSSSHTGGRSMLRVTQHARSPTRLLFIGWVSQGPSHNGVIYPLMTHVVPRHWLCTVINEAICIWWQSASRGSPPCLLNESFQTAYWNAWWTLACRRVLHVDGRCSPPWNELW